MHDLSLSSSDQNSSASFECGKLIEQVQKHDLFERNAAQFRYSIYLGNKILVFELMFGKVFNPIIEALGYRQQIEKLNKAVETGIVVLDDGSPSDNRWIAYLDLKDKRVMGINRPCAGYDSCWCQESDSKEDE